MFTWDPGAVWMLGYRRERQMELECSFIITYTLDPRRQAWESKEPPWLSNAGSTLRIHQAKEKNKLDPLFIFTTRWLLENFNFMLGSWLLCGTELVRWVVGLDRLQTCS